MHLDFHLKFLEIYRCEKNMFIENYGAGQIKRYVIPASNKTLDKQKHLFTGAFFLEIFYKPGGLNA